MVYFESEKHTPACTGGFTGGGGQFGSAAPSRVNTILKCGAF